MPWIALNNCKVVVFVYLKEWFKILSLCEYGCRRKRWCGGCFYRCKDTSLFDLISVPTQIYREDGSMMLCKIKKWGQKNELFGQKDKREWIINMCPYFIDVSVVQLVSSLWYCCVYKISHILGVTTISYTLGHRFAHILEVIISYV